jgi:hypothetical protein
MPLFAQNLRQAPVSMLRVMLSACRKAKRHPGAPARPGAETTSTSNDAYAE